MSKEVSSETLDRKIARVNQFQARFLESEQKIKDRGNTAVFQIPEDTPLQDFLDSIVTIGEKVRTQREKLHSTALFLSEKRTDWQNSRAKQQREKPTEPTPPPIRTEPRSAIHAKHAPEILSHQGDSPASTPDSKPLVDWVREALRRERAAAEKRTENAKPRPGWDVKGIVSGHDTLQQAEVLSKIEGNPEETASAMEAEQPAGIVSEILAIKKGEHFYVYTARDPQKRPTGSTKPKVNYYREVRGIHKHAEKVLQQLYGPLQPVESTEKPSAEKPGLALVPIAVSKTTQNEELERVKNAFNMFQKKVPMAEILRVVYKRDIPESPDKDFNVTMFLILCRSILVGRRSQPEDSQTLPDIVPSIDTTIGLHLIEEGLDRDKYFNLAAATVVQLAKIPSYRGFACDVIHSHIGRFRAQMLYQSNLYALDAVRALAEYKSDYTEQGKAVLFDSLDVLQTQVVEERNGKLKPEYLRAFDTAYAVGDEGERERIRRMIEKIIASQKDREAAKATVSAHLMNSQHTVVQEYASTFIREILEQDGLSYDDFMQSWKDLDDKDLSGDIERNLHAIQRLEKLVKGGSKILESTFGIRTFDRYPTPLLARQVRNIGDVQKPYGIVVMGRWDWKKSFYTYTPLFNSLARQFDNNYNIRFIEAGSKKELLQRLIQMDNTYGESQKISFAIGCTHSSGNDMILGAKKSKKDDIYTNDLANRRAKNLKSFFVSEPSIVLEACRSWDGIAVPLAEIFGPYVTAPDGDFGINSIKVKMRDGKPRFDVEFEGKEPTYGDLELEQLLEELQPGRSAII